MVFDRASEPLSLAILALVTLLWSGGGVLLTAAIMQPLRRERLLVGLATGLLLYITLSNVLAQVIAATPAFVAAALLVFAFGVAAAALRRPAFPLPTAAELPFLALFLAALYLAFLVNRGLSIQDDYHNLPLVSVIAAGDIPPHFYLNAVYRLAYHYGLHVAAGSMVNLGGLTPWGAFDLAKALTLALALSLAALSIRRVTSRASLVVFGTSVFAFLGGVRWLLLLAPGRWLDAVASHLSLLGSAAATGRNLHEALLRAWDVEGGGPFPFPFAFLNGIRPPPVFPIGGSALLPEVTLLLLLLVHRRKWDLPSSLLFAVLISSLAMSSEVMFLVAIGGLALGLIAGLMLARRRGWDPPAVRPVLAVLAVATVIAVAQGGLLTEVFRDWVGRLTGLPVLSYGFAGVSLVWPPRIVSAHLGDLLITDANQLLLGLIEVGPAVLLLPMALLWSAQHLRRGRSFPGGLVLASLGLALLGLVAQYDILRETSRLAGTAMMVWTIVALQPLVRYIRDGRGWKRSALVACLLAGMFGGPVLLATQLVAAARPTRTTFVGQLDSAMADRYWNRLGAGEEVFDSIPYRAVTLFGRPTRSNRTYWYPTGEFGDLIDAASPIQIADAGYSYLYLDEEWWRALSAAQRLAFTDGCAVDLHEEDGPAQTFRRLYDLRGCRTAGPG